MCCAQASADTSSVTIDSQRLGQESSELNGLYALLDHLHEARRTAACTATLAEALRTSAPVGVAYLDCDLRFLRVNQALARMNHATIAEHVGRPAAEVVPAAWSQLEGVCRAALRTGDPVVNYEVVGNAGAWISGDSLYSIYPARVGDEVVGRATTSAGPRP
jgi:PAS domain-containing protein